MFSRWALHFWYGGLVNVPVNRADVERNTKVFIQNPKISATPAELQRISISSNCYSPAGQRGSRMASVFGAPFEMRLLSVQRAIAVLSFIVLYTTYEINDCYSQGDQQSEQNGIKFWSRELSTPFRIRLEFMPGSYIDTIVIQTQD